MRQRCETIRAPVRCPFVVIARREPRQRLSQFFGKCRPGLRAGESDVAFECERRKALPLGPRASVQFRDVTHSSRGASHEVGGAKPVGSCIRRVPKLSDCLGADDERTRGGAENPLDAVAVAALRDALDQSLRLELAQVIAKPLPRRPELARQARCGVGLRQVLEQLSAGSM